MVAVILLGPDQQSPWSVIDAAHRVRGILEEIQDHLLKLDPITRDRRECTGKLRLPVSLDFCEDRPTTGQVPRAWLRSDRSNSVVAFLLLKSARNRLMTSDARLPSRIVRCAVSRAPSTFGGSAASIRRQVLALVTMPDSGWLTSWAIDAVNVPRLATLATRASSDRASPSACSRKPALGHILNRADVFKAAIPVAGRVSDQVQVFDRTIGHLQPMVVFKVAAVAARSFNHVEHQWHVIGVDTIADQLERHCVTDGSSSKMR